MTEESRSLVPVESAALTVASAPSTERRWWQRPPLKRVQAQAEYSRAQTRLFDAQALEAAALRTLIARRIELAKTVATLAALPEILEAEYRCGALERAHRIALLRLAHAEALARVYEAERALAPHAGNRGRRLDGASLSPTEIDDLLAQLPEIRPRRAEPFPPSWLVG